MAQGTLLSLVWQPGWEGSLGENVRFVSQSLSCVWLFATPWAVAHQGSSVNGILQARIKEWVAIPFSRESSQPWDQTQVSNNAGRFFTVWATRESPTWGRADTCVCMPESVLSQNCSSAIHQYKIKSFLKKGKIKTECSVAKPCTIRFHIYCWLSVIQPLETWKYISQAPPSRNSVSYGLRDSTW